MSGEWFRSPGSEGTLTLEHRKDGWYLAEPNLDTEVNCLLSSTLQLDESSGTQRVDVTVIAYMRGRGDSVDHLHLKPTTPSVDSKETTDESLDRIAATMIGDDEFVLTEDSSESVVGRAKRRARTQGRDPAIHSRFRK